MRGIGWETALQAVITRLDASAKALDATIQTVKDLQIVLVKQAMTIRELMDYRDELEKEVERLRAFPENPAIDGLCRTCQFWSGEFWTEADFGCVHYSRGVAK